jgi:hypothetical protein
MAEREHPSDVLQRLDDLLQRLDDHDRRALGNAFSKFASEGGEREAAFHQADRLLKKAGVSFTDLGQWIAPPPPPSKVDGADGAAGSRTRPARRPRADAGARPSQAHDQGNEARRDNEASLSQQLYAAEVRIGELERGLWKAQQARRPTISEEIAQSRIDQLEGELGEAQNRLAELEREAQNRQPAPVKDESPVRVRHRDIEARMIRAFAEQGAADLSVRKLAALCGVSIQSAANWKNRFGAKPRQ